MKLFNLIQTCGACPSQWEAKTEDDRMVYIRYRWGNLVVTISDKPTNDINEAVSGDVIYKKMLNTNGFDGHLSTADMLINTGYKTA